MIKLKNLLLSKIIESLSRNKLNKKGKHPTKISNRNRDKMIILPDEDLFGDDANQKNVELPTSLRSSVRITEKFRYVFDEEEALLIQSQYEKFAKKEGIEPADLVYHLMSKHGILWVSYEVGKSLSANYLVGNFVGDIFTVSHFAPHNLRTGYQSLIKFLNQPTPAVFAVPEKLASQLEKIGFKKVFKKVPMKFRGSIMYKTILINKSFEKSDYNTMLVYWMQMAIKSGLVHEDTRVKEFFNRLKSFLNKKQRSSILKIN